MSLINRQIRSRGTNENLVNGQNGTPADVPAAGQAAEAEDDSDDDQEEGAPEAGAAGGKFSQRCFLNIFLSYYTPPLTMAGKNDHY